MPAGSPRSRKAEAYKSLTEKKGEERDSKSAKASKKPDGKSDRKVQSASARDKHYTRNNSIEKGSMASPKGHRKHPDSPKTQRNDDSPRSSAIANIRADHSKDRDRLEAKREAARARANGLIADRRRQQSGSKA